MEDVVSARCAMEGCTTFAHSKRYQGYCLRCFTHVFPDVPVVRNYKTKERCIAEHVARLKAEDTRLAQAVIRYDKRVDGGCSLRRPDIFVELGTHVVIVEVDEQQHDREEYHSCENKRMMQLYTDLAMRQTAPVMLQVSLDARRHDCRRCRCTGLPIGLPFTVSFASRCRGSRACTYSAASIF